MSPPPTELHPQAYRPRMSTWWWLRRRTYAAFVLRELSSVFVAWTVVYLLLLVRAVSAGPEDYRAFLDRAATPWMLVLNVVALLFVAYHAVTWSHLTPKAMVMRLRGRPVPDRAVLASVYVGWAAVSAFLAWLVLRG